MLRSIFVPLDGSAFGAQALPVAWSLARRAGAAVTLAHVHVPAATVSMGSWNLAGVPVVDEAHDDEARASDGLYLEQLRAHSGLRPTEVACRVLDGPIAPTLVDAAAEDEADLIVLTTH